LSRPLSAAYEHVINNSPWTGGFRQLLAFLNQKTDKEKGAKKRLIHLILHVFMEAEPGIEPRSTALQAAALLYISVGYNLCHS